MEPVMIHSETLVRMSLGRLKKNLSSIPAVTSTCQAPTNTRPSTVCHTSIGSLRRGRRTSVCFASLIAPEDLLSQICPHVPVYVLKFWVRTDIDEISGTCE